MVCAGAGLAPFRGFIQDRAEKIRGAPGTTLAPALLFFGCRGPESALYADELQDWQDAGVVEVQYAYSRDISSPNSTTGAGGSRYVQDLVWAERDALAQSWAKGARVYICGSRDLSHGLKDIVQKIYREQAEIRCGPKTDADVESWWVEILRDRYAAEVF